MANKLFSLDIGTRSVVGIILEENNNSYHVADLVSIEHKERSMIDGQIHNIISVAEVISEIKEVLESRHGILTKVSVAAAGRALKTSEGSMEVDISENTILTNEDINRLELAAVQQAQQQLLSSDLITKDDYYYCVGYSVLHYRLEGEKIGSLIEQVGRVASVDVIATFLPRVVVESLLSALKHAGLEMEALTLEPIAAINALVPPSMRRLNVALVDIGAGTSDIALTNNGTVVAYGMVPIAGDEITEALSNHYILDFPLAENSKRKLSTDDEIVIQDILGFEQTLTSNEVIKILEPTVQRLSISISNEIQRLNNNNSPQAVIVVGGGSLTPGLTKQLSLCLNLPETRIGIRGLEALSDITTAKDIISSPALVTPIGIAIAAKRAPIHYMSVSVNEKTIRLFEMKEMTVGDALLATNIKARQLYGKPGLGMTVSLNGNDYIIPGEHGTPAVILLNGQPSSTKQTISNGDAIELIPGKDGNFASATIRNLLDDLPIIAVTIDGAPVLLEPEIIINGKIQQIDTPIQDRDKISVSSSLTLATALEKLGRKELINENTVSITANNNKLALKKCSNQFYIGDLPIDQFYNLKEGDVVTLRASSELSVTDIAVELGMKVSDKITVIFNGSKTTIIKKRLSFTLNNSPVDNLTKVKGNDRLELTPLDEGPFLFSDVFAFTDYRLPENSSGNYLLLRNGESIGFNDPIYTDDILQIVFT